MKTYTMATPFQCRRASLQGKLRLNWGAILLWLLGGLWFLWCLTGVVAAQETTWERATQAGVQAFNQGQYGAAEQQFRVALASADETRQDALRLATSLMHLGSTHYMQGQYAQAAPLYARALELQEQVLGAEHPQLVEGLSAVAAVERKLHPVRSRLPWSTAHRLDLRARRLQAREAEAMAQEVGNVWFGQIQEFPGNDY